MIAANPNPRRRPLTGRMVLICLLAFFGVVSLANAIMIRAAMTTFSGLETASAYQAGQNFEHEAEAARAQQERHWQVRASVRPADGKTLIEIDARDAAGLPLAGLEATMQLQHPTDRRADQAVSLSEETSGHFRGTAAPLTGQWDVLIDLSRGGERVFRSLNRVVLH
jgi:nitrogen fixation protein FixH